MGNKVKLIPLEQEQFVRHEPYEQVKPPQRKGEGIDHLVTDPEELCLIRLHQKLQALLRKIELEELKRKYLK